MNYLDQLLFDLLLYQVLFPPNKTKYRQGFSISQLLLLLYEACSENPDQAAAIALNSFFYRRLSPI